MVDPAPGELAGEQGKLASCGQARVFLTTMSKKSPVRRDGSMSWTDAMDLSLCVSEVRGVSTKTRETRELL